MSGLDEGPGFVPTADPMTPELERFLEPLFVDSAIAHRLAHELHQTFRELAAESLDQFLPTPISESILRPTGGSEKGRHLAIDIGGTNVRVGFIELLGSEGPDEGPSTPNIRQVFEKSWSIQEHLKNGDADLLFAWIGSCIAEVVREGVEVLGLDRDAELPMGVTFSFPIIQNTLSEAKIKAMGKGFAITSDLDLGTLLVNGYNKARSPEIPRIKVAAIVNDAVATLVSCIYRYRPWEDGNHKAAMGLICGTGTNATIPLRRSTLNPQKLPVRIAVGAEDEIDDIKIAVNTEWSINGSAPPLRKLGLITKWDMQLDAEGEVPGFQPLEYMTAGRYLGELARLVFVDYLKTQLGVVEKDLPPNLLCRFGLTTAFLSYYHLPESGGSLESSLEAQFPPGNSQHAFRWTKESSVALFHIAQCIEIRAAALVAAAIVGLLACAGDIPLSVPDPFGIGENGESRWKRDMTLIVGWTGGCFQHFQGYQGDCQSFLDDIMEAEFGSADEVSPLRVELRCCDGGGIAGAAVLCGVSQAASRVVI